MSSLQDPTESLKITWACLQLLCLASLMGAVVRRIKLCLPTILSTLKVGHCQLIVCSIALPTKVFSVGQFTSQTARNMFYLRFVWLRWRYNFGAGVKVREKTACQTLTGSIAANYLRLLLTWHILPSSRQSQGQSSWEFQCLFNIFLPFPMDYVFHLDSLNVKFAHFCIGNFKAFSGSVSRSSCPALNIWLKFGGLALPSWSLASFLNVTPPVV